MCVIPPADGRPVFAKATGMAVAAADFEKPFVQGGAALWPDQSAPQQTGVPSCLQSTHVPSSAADGRQSLAARDSFLSVEVTVAAPKSSRLEFRLRVERKHARTRR